MENTITNSNTIVLPEFDFQDIANAVPFETYIQNTIINGITLPALFHITNGTISTSNTANIPNTWSNAVSVSNGNYIFVSVETLDYDTIINTTITASYPTHPNSGNFVDQFSTSTLRFENWLYFEDITEGVILPIPNSVIIPEDLLELPEFMFSNANTIANSVGG